MGSPEDWWPSVGLGMWRLLGRSWIPSIGTLAPRYGHNLDALNCFQTMFLESRSLPSTTWLVFPEGLGVEVAVFAT